jgi:hypothetical protein
MALITFANGDVIDSDDLNNNFSDKTATIITNMKDSSYNFTIYCEKLAFSNAADYVFDFTPPDDCTLYNIDLRVFSGTASITIGFNLQAITILEEVVDTYIAFRDYATSVVSVIGEASQRAITPGTLVLKKGITYRITLTSSSATAVDRACVQLLLTGLLRKA